jgi:hypothetical protein
MIAPEKLGTLGTVIENDYSSIVVPYIGRFHEKTSFDLQTRTLSGPIAECFQTICTKHIFKNTKLIEKTNKNWR